MVSALALTDSGHCTRFRSHQILSAKALSIEGTGLLV